MSDEQTFSQLEARYKQPFARWSSTTWNNLVVAFLPGFTSRLKSQLNDQETSLVVEAYLDLVAQGIGRGYFYPHPENEFPNFFLFAWKRLLPAWILKSSSVAEKLDTIAKLWNLASSLSKHPAWIESLLISKLTEQSHLSDISDELKKIETLIFQTEGTPLTPQTELSQLKYRNVKFINSPYFLPDSVRFEAPGLITTTGMKLINGDISPESFFVLIRPDTLVFPQLVTEGDPSREKFKDYVSLIERIVAEINLDVSDYAINHQTLAVVFKGSQRLHLWTHQ